MIGKKGLGKGLNILIPAADASEPSADVKNAVVEIDINKIEPNRNQPRKRFDEGPLLELAESIKSYGVIQPLIVKDENGFYSIIAGERRWRAARIAKLATVPAIVRDYTEMETLQVALIENLQRKDLNPIEEASCFKRLIDEFFFTQEDIAAKIGRSRNAISYSVGLLNLSEGAQDLLIDGKLTPGHGHALLWIKEPELQQACAEKIAENGLSVRETEKYIKSVLDGQHKKNAPPEPEQSSYSFFEDELKSILGTRVYIRDGKNKGKIEIEYYSKDELDRLLCFFKK